VSDIELSVLPFGFCPECLEKFLARREYKVHTLPDGSKLVECYCPHREVGGTMLLKEGRRQYWRLLSPIDVIEFQTKVAHEIGARRAIMDSLG
jgi:hypothetical protein